MDNHDIKFRVWIDKEEMQADKGFMHMPNDTSDFELVSNGDGGFSLIANYESWVDESKFEVIQYTGYNYKDTGEEMYTGDVVYIAGLGNCEIGIDKFYGIVAIQGKYETPLIDCILEGDHPVKLGDKYQNPELLK